MTKDKLGALLVVLWASICLTPPSTVFAQITVHSVLLAPDAREAVVLESLLPSVGNAEPSIRTLIPRTVMQGAVVQTETEIVAESTLPEPRLFTLASSRGSCRVRSLSAVQVLSGGQRIRGFSVQVPRRCRRQLTGGLDIVRAVEGHVRALRVLIFEANPRADAEPLLTLAHQPFVVEQTSSLRVRVQCRDQVVLERQGVSAEAALALDGAIYLLLREPRPPALDSFGVMITCPERS